MGLVEGRRFGASKIRQNRHSQGGQGGPVGWTLAEDIWRLLYCCANSSAQSMPARTQTAKGVVVPSRPPPPPHGSMFPLWPLWSLGAGLCVCGALVWTSATPAGPPIVSPSADPTQGPPHLSQPSPVCVLTHGRHCGFSHIGAHTLYTAFSTGWTYNVSSPPLYPCSKCGQLQWSWPRTTLFCGPYFSAPPPPLSPSPSPPD